MGRRRYLYGLMGFLSLLGLIGVFTPERSFLAFFAFAADFSYFFSRSDEMLEEYMNKSAALAFYWGMAAVAAVTLVQFFDLRQAGNHALLYGFSAGWAVAVVIHAGAVTYYGFRERCGLSHD